MGSTRQRVSEAGFRGLAMLLLSLSGGASWGEEGDYAEMTLHELTRLEVFSAASLLPTELAKAAGTAYNFGRDDFRRLGIRRLDDLLRYVPGLQVNQYRKRHQSIWARGMLNRTNDKLVLLVDGVPRRQLYYSHFSLGENLPVENVEKVEIILGPASTLYGANAFGGIISITTRAFADEEKAGGLVEAADNRRARAAAWYRSDKLSAFAAGLDQDAPYRDGRATFIGEPSRQELDERYYDLFVKARPLPGLTLSGEYQRNETPFLYMPNTQDGFTEETPLYLAASYERGEVDSGKLEARLHYTRDRTTEREWEQVSGDLAAVEEQHGEMAGLTLNLFRRLYDSHLVTLGGSWQHDQAGDMDTVRYWHRTAGWLDEPGYSELLSDPEVANDDLALYVQDVWEITEQLTLTLGGRYDEYDAFGGYGNYRGALVYAPNEVQVFKLLYGTAIRTPTYREYLKELEGTDFVPPELEPESIRTLELGYVHRWDAGSLGITLFHNQFEDYIYETQTEGGGDEYFANSGEAWKLSGVELLAQHPITPELHLRAGVAWLHSELEESDAFSEGMVQGGELPYPADWSGSLHLSYDISASHNVGVGLLWGSGREDTSKWSEDDPEDFLTVNLHGFGRIRKGLSYAWGVDNLLDQRVFDPAADFSDDRYSNERSEREIWARIEMEFNL